MGSILANSRPKLKVVILDRSCPSAGAGVHVPVCLSPSVLLRLSGGIRGRWDQG